MKKVLLKRIFASTLAGTFALSLPLTAMAATGGEGGTEGDASVVGGEGKFFSVVLPTNTASNVDFTVDPQELLSQGLINGIIPTDYQTGTRLYFARINYADLKMGNKEGAKSFANYYWGTIKNETGDKKYGNTSNWMTITNKSSAPVTVELKVDWSNTDKVQIVPSREALETADKAALYMEVEASEGRTDDFYGYADLALITWNWEYDSTAYDKDGAEKKVSPKTVGEVNADNTVNTLVRAYEPTNDPEILKLRDMPAVTDADTSTYVTWVIPTVNQTYPTLHDVSEIAYRPVDAVVKDVVEPTHQAYYLRAYYLDKANALDGRHEVSGVEVWNNRNETWQSSKGTTYAQGTDKVEGTIYNLFNTAPFEQPDPDNNNPGNTEYGYDNNINMYPTYGFRLNGEANTTGWDKMKDTDMPKISLSWKVTIGEPDEGKHIAALNPVVWDGISDIVTDHTIDIEGVIDDTQYYRVKLDGTTLTSIDVSALDGSYTTTVWDSVNGSEKVDTDGFINAGVLDMIRVQDVRNLQALANEGVQHDYRVYINEIMLLNYSQAKFFVEDGIVDLTFNFTDPDGEIIPVKVILKDSRNFVNNVQG